MSSNRILVVDDHPLVRNLLVSWLQFLCPQYEIVQAATGLEALDQLGRQKGLRAFELILIDYQMPVMNGLDLARLIRQGWPNIPLVLMADPLYETRLQKEVGLLKFEGLLEKPFIFNELKKFLPHPDKN
jgi:CheY-like chemotaxis protein